MEKFYTPGQVAEVLQLRLETIYDYVKMGKLGASRFGNRYRISESDLQTFVEASKAAAVDHG